MDTISPICLAVMAKSEQDNTVERIYGHLAKLLKRVQK
jgi:hypothetical protein